MQLVEHKKKLNGKCFGLPWTFFLCSEISNFHNEITVNNEKKNEVIDDRASSFDGKHLSSGEIWTEWTEQQHRIYQYRKFLENIAAKNEYNRN